MFLDWVKREPVAFADFVKAALAVTMLFAVDAGLSAEAAAGITTTVMLFLAFVTRAAVVPNVKLSDATIEKAKSMDQADINKVQENKANGG